MPIYDIHACIDNIDHNRNTLEYLNRCHIYTVICVVGYKHCVTATHWNTINKTEQNITYNDMCCGGMFTIFASHISRVMVLASQSTCIFMFCKPTPPLKCEYMCMYICI